MPTPDIDARELDLMGFYCWRGLVEGYCGGWWFRAAYGYSKRANSAMALEDRGRVNEQIELLERWYGERNLPPRVQMVASAEPRDLGDRLAARGYTASDPTLVMVASLADVPRGGGATRLHDVPVRDWFDAWWAVSGRGGEFETTVANTMMRAIHLPKTFVTATDEHGQPVAVGMGVLREGWLAVQCMATLPHARHRGHARAVLGALATWAAANGGHAAHLAVTEENAGARALYRGAGFTDASRYYYLTAP